MAEELKGLLEKAVEEEKAIDIGQISKAFENVISGDEDVKRELSLTENIVFNVTTDGIITMSVKIEDGKPSFSSDLAEKPDFFIDIQTKTLSEIMSGEKDVMTPFMGGEIAMWKEGNVGHMGKAMDILPLITVLAEKLELKI
jgi:putative sterol carrier protein